MKNQAGVWGNPETLQTNHHNLADSGSATSGHQEHLRRCQNHNQEHPVRHMRIRGI